MGRELIGDKTHHQTATKNDSIPIQWVAFEILTEEEGKRKYTHKSDVWSFGVTMWEIFTHCEKEPYENMGDEEIVKYLMRGKRLEKKGEMNDEIYEIMKKCWEQNPSNRPTFSELYQQIKKLCPQSSSQETTITNFPISNISNQSEEEEETFGTTQRKEIERVKKGIEIENENEKQELERKIPLLKDIEIKNKLGEGNFGVVMYGIWENQEIAMKSIGSNKIRRLIKEANTLRSLQHPNVIRFYGIFKDDKGDYYLCIEFVSGGSLDHYLKKNQLSEKELLKLTISGLKGLKYLERYKK